MKFSNFVSTLAVACLAFNADATSLVQEPPTFELAQIQKLTGTEFAEAKEKYKKKAKDLYKTGLKWNFYLWESVDFVKTESKKKEILVGEC